MVPSPLLYNWYFSIYCITWIHVNTEIRVMNTVEMAYRFGHKISDAKVFAEECADLCAAHVVPYLL